MMSFDLGACLAKPALSRSYLGRAYVSDSVDNLPMKVRKLDRVGIDNAEPERSSSHCSQCGRHAEATDSHDEDTSGCRLVGGCPAGLLLCVHGALTAQ